MSADTGADAAPANTESPSAVADAVAEGAPTPLPMPSKTGNGERGQEEGGAGLFLLTAQMAWRGLGTKEIDTDAKPEKRDENINKAVAKVFRNYPPREDQ